MPIRSKRRFSFDEGLSKTLRKENEDAGFEKVTSVEGGTSGDQNSFLSANPVAVR